MGLEEEDDYQMYNSLLSPEREEEPSFESSALIDLLCGSSNTFEELADLPVPQPRYHSSIVLPTDFSMDTPAAPEPQAEQLASPSLCHAQFTELVDTEAPPVPEVQQQAVELLQTQAQSTVDTETKIDEESQKSSKP